MKRINKAFWAFCVGGIVTVLAGCGQAVPAGNLPQNITAGTNGSQSDVEKDSNKGNEVKQESVAPDQEKQKEERNDVFSFLYEEAILIPGDVFDQSVLGEYSALSEVPSCAFDGNDRVYNYDVFELTAYIDGDEERIYSIYFIDPNLPTTEGLCLGDTVDDMISLYGEDYEMVGSSYDYIRGDTMLSIVTQNDIVVGIEYRLNK